MRRVWRWLKKSPLELWPDVYGQGPWGNSVVHRIPMYALILLFVGIVVVAACAWCSPPA